jgi:hypothetical protein
MNLSCVVHKRIGIALIQNIDMVSALSLNLLFIFASRHLLCVGKHSTHLTLNEQTRTSASGDPLGVAAASNPLKNGRSH